MLGYIPMGCGVVFGAPCAETEVGLDDPCVSLPAQAVPWFLSMERSAGILGLAEPSLSFLRSLSLWSDVFRGIQGGEDESPSPAAVQGMVPTTLTSGWLHSVICKFMQSGAHWDLVVKLLRLSE